MSIRRILIIRLSAIGDVLCSTPLIRSVKRRYPDAEVDFLVKAAYAPLVQTNRHLHRIHTLLPDDGLKEIWHLIRRFRTIGYDGIFDLQVSPRSMLIRRLSRGRHTGRHRPLRGKRFLLVHFRLNTYGNSPPVPLRYFAAVEDWGVEDDGHGLELSVDASARDRLKHLLSGRIEAGKARTIVIAPGASRLTKRWLPEGFAEVGSHFLKNGFQILLVGGLEDRPICNSVSEFMGGTPVVLAGELSLQETAAAIEHSHLLISNDTGVMHMGAALGKPVVAIFGPTTTELGFFPFRTHDRVVERPLACRPCSYHGSERCPEAHFRCMREISSTDVIDAAESLLNAES